MSRLLQYRLTYCWLPAQPGAGCYIFVAAPAATPCCCDVADQRCHRHESSAATRACPPSAHMLKTLGRSGVHHISSRGHRMSAGRAAHLGVDPGRGTALPRSRVSRHPLQHQRLQHTRILSIIRVHCLLNEGESESVHCNKFVVAPICSWQTVCGGSLHDHEREASAALHHQKNLPSFSIGRSAVSPLRLAGCTPRGTGPPSSETTCGTGRLFVSSSIRADGLAVMATDGTAVQVMLSEAR